MTTNVQEFITDLDGGVLEKKLSRILSDVAGAVVDHNKPGKVSLTFELERIGNTYQVEIEHKLSYSMPTARGKAGEEEATTTPMHVGKGGKLSLFPEDQGQLFGKKGEVPAQQRQD